jgi:hypothetical protein
MSVSREGLRAPPHIRRVRGAPRRVLRPRTYALIAVGAAALVAGAGLGLGAFVIGTFAASPPQSSAGGAPAAPPGVTYAYAGAEFVNATTVPAVGDCVNSNLGTHDDPTALTNGAETPICLSTNPDGYASGDTVYFLEIVWNTSAIVSTTYEVQISVSVTPSTNDVVVASYVETSATITVNETAVFAVDLTQSGDSSVTAYDALVTQL